MPCAVECCQSSCLRKCCTKAAAAPESAIEQAGAAGPHNPPKAPATAGSAYDAACLQCFAIVRLSQLLAVVCATAVSQLRVPQLSSALVTYMPLLASVSPIVKSIIAP